MALAEMRECTFTYPRLTWGILDQGDDAGEDEFDDAAMLPADEDDAMEESEYGLESGSDLEEGWDTDKRGELDEDAMFAPVDAASGEQDAFDEDNSAAEDVFGTADGEEDEETEDYNCPQCQAPVEDVNDGGEIQCEGSCAKWFHLRCLNLPPSYPEEVARWLCAQCYLQQRIVRG